MKLQEACAGQLRGVKLHEVYCARQLRGRKYHAGYLILYIKEEKEYQQRDINKGKICHERKMKGMYKSNGKNENNNRSEAKLNGVRFLFGGDVHCKAARRKAARRSVELSSRQAVLTHLKNESKSCCICADLYLWHGLCKGCTAMSPNDFI